MHSEIPWRSGSEIDPAYSVSEPIPTPDIEEGAPWLYGDGEFEAYRLKVLRQRSNEVCTHVGYPGIYYEPAPCIHFRLSVDRLPQSISFRAAGEGALSIADVEIGKVHESNDTQSFAFDAEWIDRPGEVRFKLTATTGQPPALLIKHGPCSTSLEGWECSIDGMQWMRARPVPQTRSAVVPHLAELPTMLVEPIGVEDGVYDFGRTLLGRVLFQCDRKPRLFVGESREEAMCDDLSRLEQRADLERGPEGVWQSRFQLAFRYVRVEGGHPTRLVADATFRPEQYRGTFACSDERLTRIWEISAYSLRCCMNDLMLDGLKRDRLPWIGDQVVSLMANAYTFADAEVCRRTYTALGRNGIEASDINGIVDYSLWWVIVQDMFQLYFDDADYVEREWPRIKALLAFMEARCDPNGYLQPRPDAWLFIDWGVEARKDLTNVALQVLWFWALNSGAALAERVEQNEQADRWRTRAERLAQLLHEQSWDNGSQGFRQDVEEPDKLGRHANILAVLAELATQDQRAHIKARLLDDRMPRVITPFMTSLELVAFSRLGASEAIGPHIENFWGRQLDHSATTFWEKYDPAKPEDLYSMYERPFANSLCHAWSSGPAAILPAEILGIRPLDDGWKRFAVDPRLGSLEWIRATVPTGFGNITVDVEGDHMTLTVPAGTFANWNDEWVSGPQTFEKKCRTKPTRPDRSASM